MASGRKMSFAPKTCAKSQTKMSAWTPLNHQLSNNNVFVERRNLLGKWFDKWSDGQRKVVLQDFLSRCSVGTLRFLSLSLSRQLPQQAADFTCLLPRVLSLYLLSFLDPRSLCRCTQVCWRWRHLVELDQLWMPKCLRLGWYINFSPTPFEQGVWKRHYIQTVLQLHTGKPQTSSQQQFVVPDVMAISSLTPVEQSESHQTQQGRGAPGRGSGTGAGKQAAGLPPWRGADKDPKDTLRFNYLANLDPVEQAHQAQMKSRANTTTTSNKAMPDNTNTKTLSEANYKLRKAKSLMFLSLDPSSDSRPHHHHHHHHQQNQGRPDWATRSLDYPVTKETVKSLVRSTRWNAGIRPGPVRLAVPRLSAEAWSVWRRSHRSTPSLPPFEGHPWRVPPSSQETDEE